MKNAIRFTSLLFILFSLYSQIAQAQIDEVVVTGYRNSSDPNVLSNWTTGTPIYGTTPISPSYAAERKAEARKLCNDRIDEQQKNKVKQIRDDYAFNIGVCNTVLGVPGAALTGSGVMDALKKAGWRGKAVAGLGAAMVYGATACKDWAAAHRDSEISDAEAEATKTKNTQCNF